MLVRVTPLERVRDNRSGFFAVWTNDSRRRRRYTSVRLDHETCRMMDKTGMPECFGMLSCLMRAKTRRSREAYLALCVARAQARCGLRSGYDRLIDFLTDIRAFIARSAHDELVALSGREFDYDAEAWRRWLGTATVAPKRYECGE